MIAIGAPSLLAPDASPCTWMRSQQMKVHPGKSSFLQVKKSIQPGASRAKWLRSKPGTSYRNDRHENRKLSASPSRFLAPFSGF